jgi:hypothetical protein
MPAPRRASVLVVDVVLVMLASRSGPVDVFT